MASQIDVTQTSPLVWNAQKVAVHGFAETCPIQFRRYDGRHFALSTQNAWRLDERLQSLVPRKSPDVIWTLQIIKWSSYELNWKKYSFQLKFGVTDYANDELIGVIVDTNEQRVIHDQLRGKELSITLQCRVQYAWRKVSHVQRVLPDHCNSIK